LRNFKFRAWKGVRQTQTTTKKQQPQQPQQNIDHLFFFHFILYSLAHHISESLCICRTKRARALYIDKPSSAAKQQQQQQNSSSRTAAAEQQQQNSSSRTAAAAATCGRMPLEGSAATNQPAIITKKKKISYYAILSVSIIAKQQWFLSVT
jgi:hypothetical protein